MKKFVSCVLILVLAFSIGMSAFAIASVKVTGIKLDQNSITLTQGDITRLNVTYTPENTTQKLLAISSSNKNVVDVQLNGVLVAVAPGKATITVASQSNASLTASLTVTVKAKKVTTLQVMLFERGTVGYVPADQSYYAKWIVENFQKANPDIKLKFVIHPRWPEYDRLNIWMASNTAPDICFANSNTVPENYYSKGGLAMLDDALKVYGQDLLKWYGDPNLVLNKGKVEGHQIMIPARRTFSDGNVTWIRKDWLDALNLPLPTTRDEWYQDMKAFKDKNPGKVGKVIPFGLTDDPQWTATTLLESFVTDKTEKSRYLANENIETKLLAPGYKEGVRFLNKMYNEGLVSKEFPLDAGGKILESNTSNNFVGSVIQKTDTVFNLNSPASPASLKKLHPEYNLVAVDPFKDKDGVTTKKASAATGLFVFVPKASESKVDEAIRYLNWMANKDVIFKIQFGEEGISYKLNDQGLPVLVPNDQIPADKNEYKVNASNNIDLTLILNGVDTGDMAKNIKLASLPYKSAGVADQFINGLTIGMTNGYVDPIISLPAPETSKYSVALDAKGKEVYAKAITAKPEDFDAVWSKMIDEFVKAGAGQVLNERRGLWTKDHSQ